MGNVWDNIRERSYNTDHALSLLSSGQQQSQVSISLYEQEGREKNVGEILNTLNLLLLPLLLLSANVRE